MVERRLLAVLLKASKFGISLSSTHFFCPLLLLLLIVLAAMFRMHVAESPMYLMV